MPFHDSPFTIHHSRFTIHNSPFTIHNSPFTIHHSPFTIHHSRLIHMAGILDLVGNTPLAELKNISQNKNVRVYAKLEGNNPGGSVKDRAAYGMIKGAYDRGELTPGIKLIEATSGNTGIALAMIASLFGVEIELVMPEDATRERVLTMQAFGARVILTPKQLSMEGAIDYANSKVAGGGYLMLNQFANPDNYLMHYRTTGPEIWRDTNGRITHFVSAMGTTGTIMGVSRFLKEQNSTVQIVGCQPTDGSHIPGIRKWPEAYLPKIFDRSRIDRIMEVDEQDARTMTRRLAREEAVFSGMSSGGAVYAASQLAKELTEGVIVCIICDRGDRYLSSDLFD
jgi:cysteine synthase B